jgi:hypothetical protein
MGLDLSVLRELEITASDVAPGEKPGLSILVGQVKDTIDGDQPLDTNTQRNTHLRKSHLRN